MSINTFFNSIYHQDPVVTQEKKNTRYAVAGKEINVVTDPYGGCHIEAAKIPGENLTAIRNAIQTLCNDFATSKAYDSVWLDLPLPSKANEIGAIAPDSFAVGVHGKSDVIYDYPKMKIRFWQ